MEMYCLLEGALSVKGYGSALSVILKVPLGHKGGNYTVGVNCYVWLEKDCYVNDLGDTSSRNYYSFYGDSFIRSKRMKGQLVYRNWLQCSPL